MLNMQTAEGRMGALAASMKAMKDRIAGFTNRHHRIEITFTQVSRSFPRQSVTIKGKQAAQRMKKKKKRKKESRRDQDEGGELDSHEEASPEETECREVVLGYIYRERVQLLLLQSFPNGGATDIVFVTVLHSSWDSNCVVWWALRNAGRTQP